MFEGLATTLAQFGAAGLIGLLWIMERRFAAARERQLDDAHRTLAAQDRELDALLTVVKENTRAIIRLEQSQLRLTRLLEQLRTGDLSDHDEG